MSHTSANGESWNNTNAANILDALNQIERTGERFSQDHQIGHARTSRLLGSAYANAHLDASFQSNKSVGGQIFQAATGIQGSVGASIGARLEGSRELANTNNKTYSQALDMATSQDYAHNIDTALRAISESHFRTGDDIADRLLDNIQASLDKAQSMHQDATSSFQEAQNYQTMASLSQDQAVSVNANASQPFVEWLAREVDSQTQAPMGLEKAAELIAHHPQMAQEYADQFSKQYTQSLEQTWAGTHGQSKEAIENAAHNYQKELNTHDLSQTYEKQKAEIDSKPNAQHLSLDKPLDETFKQNAQEALRKTQAQFDHEKESTLAKTHPLKTHIDDKLHPHRHEDHDHDG